MEDQKNIGILKFTFILEAPAGFKAVKSQENSHEAMAWRSLGVVTALLDPEELPVNGEKAKQ